MSVEQDFQLALKPIIDDLEKKCQLWDSSQLQSSPKVKIIGRRFFFDIIFLWISSSFALMVQI